MASSITSYVLPSANVTFTWRGTMLHNSNKGEGGALIAPYTPFQQTILKGWFLHITYEIA